MGSMTKFDLVKQILSKYPDRVPAYVKFPEEYKDIKNKYDKHFSEKPGK